MVQGVREFESESSSYVKRDVSGRVVWHKESRLNGKRVPLGRAVYIDEETAFSLSTVYQAGGSLDNLFSSVKEEFKPAGGRILYELVGKGRPELEMSAVITTII